MKEFADKARTWLIIPAVINVVFFIGNLGMYYNRMEIDLFEFRAKAEKIEELEAEHEQIYSESELLKRKLEHLCSRMQGCVMIDRTGYRF